MAVAVERDHRRGVTEHRLQRLHVRPASALRVRNVGRPPGLVGEPRERTWPTVVVRRAIATIAQPMTAGSSRCRGSIARQISSVRCDSSPSRSPRRQTRLASVGRWRTS
jgi:hypothetical protein